LLWRKKFWGLELINKKILIMEYRLGHFRFLIKIWKFGNNINNQFQKIQFFDGKIKNYKIFWKLLFIIRFWFIKTLIVFRITNLMTVIII
jgi:hypothetical protein